jgi:hypothetical protein
VTAKLPHLAWAALRGDLLLYFMKHILFPFIGLFETRSLKQRWWHRLFVVSFFVTFLFVTGLAIYFVSTMGDPIDRSLIVRSFPELQEATEGVDFVYAPPVPPVTLDMSHAKRAMLSPKDEISFVDIDRVGAALAAGYRLAIADANGKWVPDTSRSEIEGSDKRVPIPPGATIDNTRDVFRMLDTERNGSKVTVFRAGVVAFPSDMPEDQINKFCAKLYDVVQAGHRKDLFQRWSLFLAFLLLAFYIPQGGYRLFLYVVLGPKIVG